MTFSDEFLRYMEDGDLHEQDVRGRHAGLYELLRGSPRFNYSLKAPGNDVTRFMLAGGDEPLEGMIAVVVARDLKDLNGFERLEQHEVSAAVAKLGRITRMRWTLSLSSGLWLAERFRDGGIPGFGAYRIQEPGLIASLFQ